MFGEIPSHFDTCIQISLQGDSFFSLTCGRSFIEYTITPWYCGVVSSQGQTSKCDSHGEKTALLLASPRFQTENEEHRWNTVAQNIPMYKNYIHFKYRGTLPYGHLGNTITLLLWPLFYGRENSHRFLYKKHMLMWSAMATFTVPNSTILYNFIPLN